MKYDVSLLGAVPLLVRRAPPTNYTGADRAIFLLLFSFSLLFFLSSHGTNERTENSKYNVQKG